MSSVERETELVGQRIELRAAPDPGPVDAYEVVSWTEPVDADEAFAEITAENPYDVAVLRLAPGWSEWDRRMLNLTIAHELCHLLIRDLWLAAESVESFAPPHAWSVFKSRWDHHEEQAVDRLAKTLVDRLGMA